MNNYKEKLFKGITYTAALFTIIFLFGIIISIFVEGSPIIGHDLGALPVDGVTHEFPLPWEPVEHSEKINAYCEVTIDGEPASDEDIVAAFVGRECRGSSTIFMEDGYACSDLVINHAPDAGDEVVRFTVYDASAESIYEVSFTNVLKKGKEIGELDYRFPLDTGTPVVYPREWEITEYSQKSTVWLDVSFDGMSASEGDEVAAFINSECRGIGKVSITNGKALVKIDTYSNEDEMVYLSYYDNYEHKVYGISSSFKLSAGKDFNTANTPLVINSSRYAWTGPYVYARPWKPVTYSGKTTAYLQVKIDDLQAEEGDEVGIFLKGECRGVGYVTKKGKKALVTMEIEGDEADRLDFAIWDKSSNEIIPVHFKAHTNPGGIIGYPHDKPVIGQVFERISHFVGDHIWHPTQEPGEFGILALILGSLLVTIGALLLAIPFGIGSAIYISEIASPKVREVIKPIIELLAGIPSVVYGLFGMAFLSPALMKWFNIDTGLNIFNASIILGIMVIPIISSMSEDALSSVPKNLRQASYGLGANRWETIIRIVLPAAKTGVIGSILLGFGRAIGETMVVIMVAGGSPQIPSSIFDPVRPMTAAVAAEMGETAHGTLHFHALFGVAVVLFAITFITNLISEFAFYKQKKG